MSPRTTSLILGWIFAASFLASCSKSASTVFPEDAGDTVYVNPVPTVPEKVYEAIEMTSPSAMRLTDLLKDDIRHGRQNSQWARSSSSELRRILASQLESSSSRTAVDAMVCTSHLCKIHITISGPAVAAECTAMQIRFQNLALDASLRSFEFGGPYFASMFNPGDESMQVVVIIPRVRIVNGDAAI